MKQRQIHHHIDQATVAPHAGAWIETPWLWLSGLYDVAPHAGAWIETSSTSALTAILITGRPPRGGVD